MSRLIRAALVLVLVVGATVAVPAGAQADSSSNIPGVPIPGSVVTGQLGGPIYDVVYRITMPAGAVLVAGLSGSPGTLFGLYLFDSTATTVVGTQGLVASSTVVGTQQHIAYSSPLGGTYYLDLNGASNVEGTYTLVVQVVADTTPPVASLLLDNGRALTNSPTVSVILTGYTSLSGLSQMAFSADGVSWGAWLPYAAASSWTFPAGDGVKTLWAKVMNGVGVASAPISASITLDTVRPTVTVIQPTADSAVAGLRPTFTVRFSKPINPASWSNFGLVVQAANGSPVSGTYAYDASSWTGSFTPAVDLAAGQPYVVTVGGVTDLAGNVVAPIPSWTVTPLRPTSLVLSRSARVILPGASVTLTATTPGLDTSAVFLQTLLPGAASPAQSGPFTVVDGSVSTTVSPQMNTGYQFLYPGSRTDASTTSNQVRVIVRRLVSLVGVPAAGTQSAKAGRPITLTAQVEPVGSVARLSFQRYRYDAVHRRWVYAGSFGRTTDAAGEASVTWTPTAGRWYWRVASFPTPDYANNVSPVYRWLVAG
ncbi:MAG: Ig-like domain-containing protein [Candidatus Limnocylindrales bacterium]